MEAAQNIKEEAGENMAVINEYTYQSEQVSMKRKEYAASELLGGLSDDQMRLVDINNFSESQ